MDTVANAILKRLNIAFENQPLEVKQENVETAIKIIVGQRILESTTTNFYGVVSNILKLMIEQKEINPNFLLAVLVKHTKNYIGLLLIGMVVRKGANPNIYFRQPGYGVLHILCLASVRSTGGIYDSYFRYIVNLLRFLGSNIDMPAYKVKEYDNEEIDVKYVEKIAMTTANKIGEHLSVTQFVKEQGKIPNEDLQEFYDTISDNYLVHFILATDSVETFNVVGKSPFMIDIVSNVQSTQKFLFNLSTAGAINVANQITNKNVPSSTKLINAQTVPIYSAILCFDKELFKLMVAKNCHIKYTSINQIIAGYKKYKDDHLRIYINAYNMLLDAVKVGSEIDLYQYELFSSSADFDELEEIKKAYEQPRWKKLCSIISDKNSIGGLRQEIRELAFNLNLDMNASEEQSCNKFKHISLINRNDYFQAAIQRQEDRVALELSTSEDYLGQTNLPNAEEKPKPRCNPKSMILQNPYAYCDSRMAFYKDPKDGEVWCFTADTFNNLIQTKVNFYTGEALPDKFIETLRSQVNILRDMGLFDYNHTVEDTLKEYFDRGNRPNNRKTDYAVNTASRCLSLYGVSEQRLSSLKTITLEDTILKDICGVKLTFFDILTTKHQLITTLRIIYSISKEKDFDANQFYETIARSINGDFGMDLNLNVDKFSNGEFSDYLKMYTAS